MALTLAEANRIVEGAIAAANEMGIKINVAVCRRRRPPRWPSTAWTARSGEASYGSQGKAVASAAFGRSSGELQERSELAHYLGASSSAEGEPWHCQPGRAAHHSQRRG